MFTGLFLCLVFIVGPAVAADWSRLNELPVPVSNSEVVVQYTDGSFRPLAAFSDSTKLTVAVFTDFLSSWELDNGRLPKLLGWIKDDNDYASVWVFPPDERQVYIQFTHLLSKRHGAGTRSRFTALKGAVRVFGRDDVGSALTSEFVRELRGHLFKKHRESVVLDEVLDNCKEASDLKQEYKQRCVANKDKCFRDGSNWCVTWRAQCERDPSCPGLLKSCPSCSRYAYFCTPYGSQRSFFV